MYKDMFFSFCVVGDRVAWKVTDHIRFTSTWTWPPDKRPRIGLIRCKRPFPVFRFHDFIIYVKDPFGECICVYIIGWYEKHCQCSGFARRCWGGRLSSRVLLRHLETVRLPAGKVQLEVVGSGRQVLSTQAGIRRDHLPALSGNP